MADGVGSAPAATPFAGFPNSANATAIPNLFFARVLPEIESAEELVVSVYFFFAQQTVRRTPRFLTKRELEADATLLRSLSHLAGEPMAALAAGLARAVARGTLFRTAITSGGREEDAYAINLPANRRAIAASTGRLDEPLPPADGRTAAGIFSLYEENIGSITPLIAEDLKEAEVRYPPEWLREAFREAVSLNKRNWRYIERILNRWEIEGPSYEKPERDSEAERLARRYASGKGRRAGATRP